MRRVMIFIAVVILAIAALVFFRQNTEQRLAADRATFDLVMNEKMRALYSQAQDWSAPLQFDVTDPRLNGDYKILAEFVLNYWVENIEVRNTYLRELKAVKWDQFLDVDRLDQDRKNKYQQTDQMLKTAHQVTEHYQQQSAQNKQAALEHAKTLPIDETMREGLLEKLEHNLKVDQESALIVLELQVLDKADAMLAMLKKYPWQKQDGKILFPENAQVKQFNQLYQDVLKLNAKIEKKKQQNADELDDTITETEVSDTQTVVSGVDAAVADTGIAVSGIKPS